MSEKRYTLELTAEELLANGPYGLSAVLGHGGGYNINKRVSQKLNELHDRAKADREADELRLPWKAVQHSPVDWAFSGNRACGRTYSMSECAAKLAAAAPELLEAVKAAKEVLDWFSERGHDGTARPRDLIERALRKVETGTPEEP